MRVGTVDVVDIVPPARMLVYLRAVDVAVTEGSNMTQEAAALGTPIIMVPGAIYETWLLATRLHEQDAARINWIERVTPELERTNALEESLLERATNGHRFPN